VKTYDIKSEFFEIQQLLENEEFNEETGELIDNSETIKQLLNEIVDERDSKADNIAYLIKEANDTELALKEEVTRLNKRKKMFIRQQDSLKQLLDFLLGGKKLKTNRFTFSYTKSTSVNILDESLISEEYMKIETTKTPIKKDIKEAIANLKEDETFAGAELVTKTTLGVK
jgi:hypothetical protein